MNKYQNSKIYKLVSKDASHGLIYIGSTTQPLYKRLSNHKQCFKCYQNKKYNYVSSFDLFEKGEVDIIELEKFPCNDKQELHARERHYIETLDCVNKVIPSRTQKEYRQANKDKIKEYQQSNKDKLEQYIKQYREANKDKIKEQVKEYYQANRDKVKEYQKEYMKEYQQSNKAKLKEYNKQYRLKKKIKEEEINQEGQT